jgi:hypothetical protein
VAFSGRRVRERLARRAQETAAVATAGRAFRAIQTRDLEGLFDYFALDAESRLVEAHRTAIATRFAFEVQEIMRLCSGLRERERFRLFREALRLAYEGAVQRAGATCG